jgi:hypothetical protein
VGFPVEVKLTSTNLGTGATAGNTNVAKHYSMGRIAWELAFVMPDNKTVYGGDDGSKRGLFRYVSDRAEDLTAGTLYAAKLTQTSSVSAANGGSFDISWINLGHATDAEIDAAITKGVKFSDLFDQCLRVQCVLKGICTDDEWKVFREHIHYDFIKDNNFTELKEAELMQQRLTLLGSVDPYTGRYFSQAWIQRNVLRLNDDEIKVMQKEIEEEKEAGIGLPVAVTNDVAQQQMVSQIGMDSAEHQNKLDMKLDQSKEKNPAKQDYNEGYSPTLGIVKRIIS